MIPIYTYVAAEALVNFFNSLFFCLMIGHTKVHETDSRDSYVKFVLIVTS